MKSWADALVEQAKRKSGKERESLVIAASEKYLSIENYKSLAMLAADLCTLAVESRGPEQEKLFKLSCDNFKAASQCVKNDPKESFFIFNSWGNTLLKRSLFKSGEEALPLLDEAGEHFVRAHQAVPDMDKELSNWAKKKLKPRELAAVLQLYQSSSNSSTQPSTNNSTTSPFEHIDSSGCALVTDNILTKVVQEFPSIQTMKITSTLTITGSLFVHNQLASLTLLDLQDCRMIGDEVVTNISKNCNALFTLNLSGCYKLNLLPFAQKMDSLRTLELHDCKKISDHALNNIGTWCPSVTDVNLSGCMQISNEGLAFLTSHCTQIVALNLNNCKKLSDESVVSISKSLKGLQQLKLNGLISLTKFSLIPLAQQCKSLVLLKVSNCAAITDDCVIAVAENLLALEHLDLARYL